MAGESGTLGTLERCVVCIATALLAVALSGCAAEEVCAPLTRCGGDIVGTGDSDGDGVNDTRWVVGGACTNQVFVAPFNATLINQSPPVQGQPPPENAHAPWCMQMTIGTDKALKTLTPWFPAIPLQDGSITYTANNTYNVQINYFEQQLVEFPKGCFTSQGFSVVAEGNASSASTFTCKEFEASVVTRLMTEPNIDRIVCGDDGAGGCNCLYDLLMVTGSNGTWSVDDQGVITHYDKVTGEPPSRADFCVKDGQLDISGHMRTFLFNQPHLRSLVLTR